MLKEPDMNVKSARFSPDSKTLLLHADLRGSKGYHRVLMLLDAQTWKILKSFESRKEGWRPAAVFSPDSSSLLLQKVDYRSEDLEPNFKHNLVVWDIKAQKETSRLIIAEERGKQHPADFWTRGFFLRKNGKRVVAVDDTGCMALLDLKTGKKVWQKELTLSHGGDRVFRIEEAKVLVVSLKFPDNPTRLGAFLTCVWYDLDEGKELNSKLINVKW